jgi:ribonuclease R
MRRADPQFEREKAKYEHPLPSREYILQTLAAQGAPLEFERLARLLDIQPSSWSRSSAGWEPWRAKRS